MVSKAGKGILSMAYNQLLGWWCFKKLPFFRRTLTKWELQPDGSTRYLRDNLFWQHSALAEEYYELSDYLCDLHYDAIGPEYLPTVPYELTQEWSKKERPLSEEEKHQMLEMIIDKSKADDLMTCPEYDLEGIAIFSPNPEALVLAMLDGDERRIRAIKNKATQ
jgi:hypothetical protein